MLSGEKEEKNSDNEKKQQKSFGYFISNFYFCNRQY